MKHGGHTKRFPSRAHRLMWLIFAVSGAALAPTSPLHAQTIRGRLLDAQNGRPIDLGILVLLTLDQDTVTLTASNRDGRFSLTAPEPGTFLLQASAFGYGPRQEGEFELGEGGVIDLDFRIPALAIALEEILVSTDRPTASHPLVQNGFVDRYRRGFGHFITPRDLERTVYRDAESLFHLIPGVRVVPSGRVSIGGRTLVGPSTDRVLMRNAWGSCTPTVYVDGIRTKYRPDAGERLSDLVLVDWLAAVEVYARPAQTPAEYGGPTGNLCGVIVFWTKR